MSRQVRNEKARRFLMNMRRKPGVQLEQYFPRADRGAVALLKKMLVSLRPWLAAAMQGLYQTSVQMKRQSRAHMPSLEALGGRQTRQC